MPTPSTTSSKLFIVAAAFASVSFLIILVNGYVAFGAEAWEAAAILAVAQFFTGMIACLLSLIHFFRAKGREGHGWTLAVAILGMLCGLGGAVALFLGFLVSSLGAGGAWGRPLRLRGKILHPELRRGSDWTAGARPDPTPLDEPTRAALEALWLHDAQKEHASVPAFSRISWMLAAVGAPAELLEGAHRAALEEIDHTRRCFALAAGYAGRSHSVEPMPDLLLGGLDLRGDPLVHLAVESLKDGCLLEDFNADVAASCVLSCVEPATKDVLERIAREERSHADFSWRMLAWLLARGGAKVKRALSRAVRGLEAVPRPTAADAVKQRLVDAADPILLRAHGRLPDAEWAALWRLRLEATTARADAMLRRSKTTKGAAQPASLSSSA